MKRIIIASALLLLGVLIRAPDFQTGLVKDTFLFSIVPIVALYALGFRAKEAGLSLKAWKRSVSITILMIAIAMPIMLYAATLPEFGSYYPLWTQARYSAQNLVLLEATMLLSMFNTEFFFRGFLLFGLEARIGAKKAILLHAFPYALVHIGKPPLELPYSFLVGIIFGYTALKTRSILPSFIAHWLGAVIFDLLIIANY